MNRFNRFLFYFNFVMVAIYALAGVFLLIYGWLQFSKMQNLILGSALIIYSAFRIYRLMAKDHKNDPELEEDVE